MNYEKYIDRECKPSRISKLLAISAATLSLSSLNLKEAGAQTANPSNLEVKTNQNPDAKTNQCSSTIHIQKGDTVYNLTKKMSQSLGLPISINEFRRVYGIGENNLIRAGQCLNYASTTSLEVKSGDTLYNIARNNNMTVVELKLLNQLSSNLIFPGQSLLVLSEQSFNKQSSTSKVEPAQVQPEKPTNLEQASLEEQIQRETQHITKETKVNGVDIETVKKAYTYWRKKGITPMGSSLLVAYASAESALDPDAIGDDGQARGLFQWHGGRQDGIPAVGEPLEKSLEFTLIEMQQDTPELYEAIMNPKSTTDELKSLGQDWLRPGIKGRREEFFDSVFESVKKGISEESTLTQTSPLPVVPVQAPTPDTVQQATFSNNKKLNEEQPKANVDGGNDEPPKPELAHQFINAETLTYHEQENVTTVEVQGIPLNIEIAKNVAQMIEDAEKEGVKLTILSGFRSNQKQYQVGLDNGCGEDTSKWPDSCDTPTAKPGKSNHQKGLAIDFEEYDYDWLVKNAEKYGLYAKIPKEPWHWSVTGY